jgi:hypothetical protein
VHRGQGHALAPVPPHPCSPDCRPPSPRFPKNLAVATPKNFALTVPPVRLARRSIPTSPPFFLYAADCDPRLPTPPKLTPSAHSPCCLGDAVVGDAAVACLARSTGSSRCAAGSGPPHRPPVPRSPLGMTLRAATGCSGGTTSCAAMSATSPSS